MKRSSFFISVLALAASSAMAQSTVNISGTVDAGVSKRTGQAAKLQSDGSRVCSQVYQPGYATIVTNRDSFDLGSSSDGCGSTQIQLCESSSEDMLKGWFQAVRNQLSQLNCPK